MAATLAPYPFSSAMMDGESHEVAFAAWPELRRENYPGTYWWWMGSAVNEIELRRSLESFHAAGLRGVHIIPIYGVKGAESQFIDYLSDEWVRMLQCTLVEAKRLDMWVDMSTGTGWPFGGPQVPLEDSERILKLAGTTVREDYVLLNDTENAFVERAAPGGEGLVVNPFDCEALKRYLVPFEKTLFGDGQLRPRAQYHDSYEYHGNWSRGVFDAFEKLNGYRLQPHLHQVYTATQDTPDGKIARIKRDFRATLADLHLEFINTWAEWSRQHGSITRNQAHGPRQQGNWLDLYAAADIPETEIFGAYSFQIPGVRQDPRVTLFAGKDEPLWNKMASSAAHVTGKPLVSSETFTWIREHFNTPLSTLKPEVDQLFTIGINHVFYHGTAYSPEGAAWPGWLFYASFENNPRNAVWRDIPALNHYIARVQSILQAGKPSNDVLVYLPIDDVWQDATLPDPSSREEAPEAAAKAAVLDPGRLSKLDLAQHLSRNGYFGYIRELEESGYACDYISDGLIARMSVEHGKITMGGGKYQALLVPKARTMRPETLEALQRLAQAGGTILFDGDIPGDVPGWGKLEQRRHALAAMKESIAFASMGEGRAQKAEIGKGAFFRDDHFTSLMAAAAVEPERMREHGLSYLRKESGAGHDYFVVNLTGKEVTEWIRMGTQFTTAMLMDPLSGHAGVPKIRSDGSHQSVYWQLKPGESLVLRTRRTGTSSSPAWAYRDPGEVVTLPGPWTIQFIEGGPQLPRGGKLTELQSWTTLPDVEAQRFSGTARYTTLVDLPRVPPKHCLLLLGDVRESARVMVNGAVAGTVWAVPFQIEIAPHLRAGRNKIEIEVTSLSANRIRDLDMRKVDWRHFYDINFVTLRYQPFDASQWPVLDSGLLSPVKLEMSDG